MRDTVSMTSLHDRLEEIVSRSGRSRRDISIAAGLAPGTLNDILKNRGRSPSVANLTAIAAVLGISPAWLLDGSSDNLRGLSESEVESWTPPERSGERPDLDHKQLARLLAPTARHPATMRININAPGAGLVAGDVIVIDINTPSEAGDIVVAQVTDLSSGEAATVLRVNLPPYLVPLDFKGETLMADGVRTAIMGRIVASFRAPQITKAT